MEVSGIERVLRLRPRPATRRTDRITFRRVRPRRRVARVVGRFITNWRTAERGSTDCKVDLPRLVGLGASASAADTGIVRLRTPLAVRSATVTPQRGTGRDHIWVCGGGRRSPFDCGLTVSVGPRAGGTGSVNTDDDVPEWATALLVALGAAGLGSIGVAAAKHSKEGGDVPDTWEELARKEYAKPDEPISARASDLSKIGAPVAAFITAVLAAVGGWVADAPLGHTVIAVAVVVAVAVGGLFYVFAADFHSRAMVAVARFNNLCAHTSAEAKANDTVKAEADQAKAVAAEAQRCSKEAQAEADKAQEEAEARTAEATVRIEEAEGKVAKLRTELAETHEELRRCIERSQPPGGEPSPASSYLTLGGLDAVAGGAPTKVYAIESAGGRILRYLVRGPDGPLRWAPETEVSSVGEPPGSPPPTRGRSPG